MKNLALFDFDGTITRKDSFLEFIKFYHDNLGIVKGSIILSPVLAAFKLGLVNNHTAKEKVIKHFFKNEMLEKFKDKCAAFSDNILPGIVKESAMTRIREHQKKGDEVVIVTASAELWLENWVKTNRVKLIGTKLEVKEGRLTGNIDGHNCHGPEKVARIKEMINLNAYNDIHVYGDSKGDFEMLEIGHYPYYKHFN